MRLCWFWTKKYTTISQDTHFSDFITSEKISLTGGQNVDKSLFDDQMTYRGIESLIENTITVLYCSRLKFAYMHKIPRIMCQ
jgi:hypothetical protein